MLTPRCRMCGKENETVSQIVSSVHNWLRTSTRNAVMTKLHLLFTGLRARNLASGAVGRSYEHFVEKVFENENATILWYVLIQTHRKIERSKPAAILLDKSRKVWFVPDVACPFDTRAVKGKD